MSHNDLINTQSPLPNLFLLGNNHIFPVSLSTKHTHSIYLRIALAEAPHSPSAHHSDTQNAQSSKNMWPLLHHDEEANCQDTQAGHYQSITIWFPLYHRTAALSQSEAPVTQKGKILSGTVSGLEGEGGENSEFHSAAYYSLQTACPGRVYNCRCVLVPGKSPCLKLLAK